MTPSELPETPFTAWTTTGWHVHPVRIQRVKNMMADCEDEQGNVYPASHLHPRWEGAHRRLMEMARREYQHAARRLASVAAMMPPEEE